MRERRKEKRERSFAVVRRVVVLLLVVCFAPLTFSLSLFPPLSLLSLSIYSPLFVTWDSVCRSSGLKSLRGCIGSLSPQPLAVGLRSYALTSALRDRRFSPIARGEVDSLHCTVSFLRAFEEGLGWEDWVPGKHGIIIEFEEPDSVEAEEAATREEEDGKGNGEGEGAGEKKKRSLRSRLRGGNSTSNSSSVPSSSSRSKGNVLSATYLPHVATEQGWGVEEAIHSLIRKAGFHGRVTEALKRELVLTRYESSMAGIGWKEYQRERERAG